VAAKKRKNAIVRGYLERVSWRVLEEYRAIVVQFIRGHAGVYALYKGEKLYYVGLARNLMGRVKHHLKDRHKGLWDRFSVYLTIEDEHIRPLESLTLRIVNPLGNRVKGGLPGAQDLIRPLKRKIDEAQQDKTATLLGGRFVSRRQRSRLRAGTGTLTLKGLVERRIQLRATYKGHSYKATLRRDGHISYKRRLFESPSSLAKVIVGRAANGWQFWRYRNSKGEWVRLAELKR
jgi:RAMA domain-containing protein